MVDDRRMSHAGVRAAQFMRHLGVCHRQPADVGFVDHRLVERRVRRRVVAPVEGPVDDDALRHEWRAVEFVGLERIGRVVAEQRLAGGHVALDRECVGVDQQLGRVGALSLMRVPRAVHPEAVPLSGFDAGDVAVMDVGGVIGQLEATLAAVVVEHAELHLGGGLREERDVDAVAVVRDAEGMRDAVRRCGGCRRHGVHSGLVTRHHGVVTCYRRLNPAPGNAGPNRPAHSAAFVRPTARSRRSRPCPRSDLPPGSGSRRQCRPVGRCGRSPIAAGPARPSGRALRALQRSRMP